VHNNRARVCVCVCVYVLAVAVTREGLWCAEGFCVTAITAMVASHGAVNELVAMSVGCALSHYGKCRGEKQQRTESK
jgi:hypothetical protein